MHLLSWLHALPLPEAAPLATVAECCVATPGVLARAAPHERDASVVVFAWLARAARTLPAGDPAAREALDAAVHALALPAAEACSGACARTLLCAALRAARDNPERLREALRVLAHGAFSRAGLCAGDDERDARPGDDPGAKLSAALRGCLPTLARLLDADAELALRTAVSFAGHVALGDLLGTACARVDDVDREALLRGQARVCARLAPGEARDRLRARLRALAVLYGVRGVLAPVEEVESGDEADDEADDEGDGRDAKRRRKK